MFLFSFASYESWLYSPLHQKLDQNTWHILEFIFLNCYVHNDSSVFRLGFCVLHRFGFVSRFAFEFNVVARLNFNCPPSFYLCKSPFQDSFFLNPICARTAKLYQFIHTSGESSAANVLLFVIWFILLLFIYLFVYFSCCCLFLFAIFDLTTFTVAGHIHHNWIDRIDLTEFSSSGRSCFIDDIWKCVFVCLRTIWSLFEILDDKIFSVDLIAPRPPNKNYDEFYSHTKIVSFFSLHSSDFSWKILFAKRQFSFFLGNFRSFNKRAQISPCIFCQRKKNQLFQCSMWNCG